MLTTPAEEQHMLQQGTSFPQTVTKVLVLWRLLQKYAVVPNGWSVFVA